MPSDENVIALPVVLPMVADNPHDTCVKADIICSDFAYMIMCF